MSLSVLSLLCLLQVWSSSSQFVFEFELVSIDTIDYQICDELPPEFNLDPDRYGPCEPFLQIFCLREGRDTQSTNAGDCPLGSSTAGIIAFTPGDVSRDSETRPGLPDGRVNRTIASQQPWPGTFQLFIEARELDPPTFPDAHLDYIFINRTLEVNADFTPIESYNGTSTSNRVVLDMRFRVMCQQDHYGADCTRFCVAQNDSVNGYYTCNNDGSIQCREGFRNPNNNCSEAITACDSSPCANGGNCTSMGAFEFACQCAVGYTGSSCGVNIDDCVSVTCPSNSMCMDGVNTFECIQTETLNTENTLATENITDIIYNTENMGPSVSVAAIGAGVAVPLVVIILIIIVIVVLVLVVRKRRAQEKPYQGQHQKDNSANSAHQLEEKFIPTTAIYATPSSPEATVHKLENPVYGDVSDDEDDVNTHDFQNPVYGEAEDDGAQQDELYTTPQAPHVQPVWEGDGPEYDYATNPGAGVVTVNVTTNGSTPASHKYTAMDESKRKTVELDVMEPYERLQHGIEPPDFVRLAEIEGAEYGSLQ